MSENNRPTSNNNKSTTRPNGKWEQNSVDKPSLIKPPANPPKEK